MKDNISDKMYKAAEVKLTYESKVKASKWYQIKCAEDAAALLFKTWDRFTIEYIEDVKLILLNRVNRVFSFPDRWPIQTKWTYKRTGSENW